MTFPVRVATRFAASCGVVCALTTAALAQESPVPEGTPLPPGAQVFSPGGGAAATLRGAAPNNLPNIMLTGYWPPSNEMLRRWSPNVSQNPQGWIGANWEGRGYNIIALFPEFPGGLGKGVGDFEVDYQDTSNDWWLYTAQIQPVAIITFSRANTTNGWELEGGNRTYVESQWTADYLAPLRPGAGLPIMDLEPPLTERYSTLPIAQIVAAVSTSGANVNAFSTVIDDGRFLSNYIGYHGNWYRLLHATTASPPWCAASGHIHVGQSTNLADALLATEVTLRTYTTWLDTQTLIRGDLDCNWDVTAADVPLFIEALLFDASGFTGCRRHQADMNADTRIDGDDVQGFVAALLAS